VLLFDLGRPDRYCHIVQRNHIFDAVEVNLPKTPVRLTHRLAFASKLNDDSSAIVKDCPRWCGSLRQRVERRCLGDDHLKHFQLKIATIRT